MEFFIFNFGVGLLAIEKYLFEGKNPSVNNFEKAVHNLRSYHSTLTVLTAAKKFRRSETAKGGQKNGEKGTNERRYIRMIVCKGKATLLVVG